MRPVLVLGVLALVVAGCLVAAGCDGGGEQGAAPPPAAPAPAGTIPGESGGDETTVPVETGPTETSAIDGGPTSASEAAVSLQLFVTAAGVGDAAAMWELMSTGTRERFGPTLDDFQVGSATEFSEGVGTFAQATYGVVVAAEIDDDLAVVAIAGERTAEGQREFAAYATAMRREDGIWRVEIAGPVALTPLDPPPGTAVDGAPVPIGAEVDAPGPIENAGLWLDGDALPGQAAGVEEDRVVVGAVVEEELEPGPHVVVVFAASGEDASALAWTFNVPVGG